MRLVLAGTISGLLLVFFQWDMASRFPVMAQEGPHMRRFDATLRTAMQQPAGVRASTRLLGMKAKATPRSLVGVFVKVVDDGSELASWLGLHGGEVLARTSGVLNVRVPWDELPAMGEVPTVEWVEASHPLGRHMDVATGSTGVNVQALRTASPRFTGRGVLIGIIDTGIDATAPAFRDREGRSRIRYLWDQWSPSSPGPTVTLPGGRTTTYAWGREFTHADFDARPALGLLDGDGHGTHVAGIAGGRDAACPGIAPEAGFLIVRYLAPPDWDTRATTSSVHLAFEYLVSRARELGLPLVVNLSLGMDLGPHDGSTLFESVIQAMIDDPAYNLVTCISAGNNRADDLHVQDRIPSGGASIVAVDMTQSEGGAPSILEGVDIWYPVGARPDLRVSQRTAATPGTELGAAAVTFGQETPVPLDFLGAGGVPTGTKVAVVQETPNPRNGDNHVRLTFTQPGTGDRSYFVIELRNPAGSASPVDFYLERSGRVNRFITAAVVAGVTAGPVSLGTVSLPGTTPGAITVGAYTTRSSWRDSVGRVHAYVPDSPLGDLACFSSMGPVRNPARYAGNNLSKPDVAAPGLMIVSQRSLTARYDESRIVDGTHVAMEGTSMASPLAAGVVALMLQENPTLTASQVKAMLFGYARRDGSTTASVPNVGFGYGKVDAEACNHVVSAPPALKEARQDASGSKWSLRGCNFAASARVLVNDVEQPGASVTWNDHTSIDLALDSRLVAVRSVTVRNPSAPEGTRDSTLALGQSSIHASAAGNPSAGGGGGGCFIATAAYGSDLEPHVQVLRRFRDRWLLGHRPGAAIVGLYYRLSPPIARVIAEHSALRFGTRVALTPVVFAIEYPAGGGTVLVLLVAASVAWRMRHRARHRSGRIPTPGTA